jgi:Ca-activated chloride channel family protein
MSFEHPYLFLLLIVPFALFATLVITNKEGIERVFDKKVLDRIKVEDSPLTNRVRNIIFFIAIFFMIVAMSEPVIKKGEQKVKISGLEIALAIDISASMRSRDLYPNRLEYAKKNVIKLLNFMPNSEFMIITFANNLFFVSPFTSDKYTLTQVVEGISKDYIQTSTNFANLALGLSDILKNKKQKIAIIVTDGGEDKELTEFEKIIKQNDIKLYVMLVGTKVGAGFWIIGVKKFLKAIR